MIKAALFIGSILFLFASNPLFSQDSQVKSLIDKGVLKTQSGNYEEALSLYNEALNLEPNNLDALVKRAFTYSLLKKVPESITDYTRIIELQPTLVIAYISRGSAYNKLEKYDLALSDFNKALELDPENQEAYNNRGWSKKSTGDKDGACEDWKKSKKLGNSEAKIILRNNQC